MPRARERIAGRKGATFAPGPVVRGSPANEHGRSEAYTHQEREGRGGPADHRPGMGKAGQAGRNGSAGYAEPDQTDCNSHRRSR